MKKLWQEKWDGFRRKCQRIMLGREMRFLLSCIATFTVHCRFEVAVGGYIEHPLLNELDKFSNTFTKPDLSDLLVLVAVYLLLRFVAQKDQRIDIGTLIFSFVLSVILLFSISFREYDSLIFVFANKYQIMLSVFCIVGFWIILYVMIRCVYFQMQKGSLRQESKTFLEKHFLAIGFCIIFLGWLPWITLNYPGSGNGDSMWQLGQFLGDETWNAHHPPLSTAIMGSLFTLGRWIIDANFGFFLYCLLQTCVGAGVFSLSMKKLLKLGVPIKLCMAGVLFFAFTPLWGAYAQWVDKDLLYAEATLLQAVCMMDVIVRRQCARRDAILLAVVSVVTVLLRHNGIYAIAPALLLLAVWLKGVPRRRIAAALLATVVIYEGIVQGLYPAIGLGKASFEDALNIPIQQTARYVCSHRDEITEDERAAIERAFGRFDILLGYDPLLSDPVKTGLYNTRYYIEYYADESLDGYLGEYLKVWFQMFLKHPETYMAAFLNMGYGYLAPVSQRIEAWVQASYFDYLTEIGLYHTLDMKYHDFLGRILSGSMTLPLIQYLSSPGFYTWIVFILMVALIKKRRYGALILFVPGLMNILVCLASPVAGTIRYALPTVAATPLLIGWTWYMVHEPKKNRETSGQAGYTCIKLGETF